MEIIKECGVCGKEFVASKMSVKYCCRGCERVAFRRREAEKKKREKENAESLLNAERNNSLRNKSFLSPEDVSVLFNVSLPTVYRYFQTGLIKAVKIRNLIADILGKMGRKLYYYHKNGGIELDFLMRHKGQCVPIECKATTGNAKSMRTVLGHPEKYHVDYAIKLGDYNVGKKDKLLTLPMYMAFLLKG